MLIYYLWIILIVLDALCAIVASAFILWLARQQDKKRERGARAKTKIESKEKALQSEVNSLRKEAKSLRELLRDDEEK